jgi:hypothetical protein
MPLFLSEIRNKGLVLDVEPEAAFRRLPDPVPNDQLHEILVTGADQSGVRVVCDTEMIGYPTANAASPAEIVLDSSQGVIPLWDKDVTLRWCFRKPDLEQFENPVAARANLEALLAEAIMAWGSGVPVKFKYADDAWDFQVVVREQPQCTAAGCVLASAFFPDAGQHELIIYPTMFDQSKKEQVETLAHEIGHIFGLRHFFALVKETAWPSVVWGEHANFTIMNYGPDSVMTAADRRDLKLLYDQVWTGKLTEIAGTKVKLVRPFHEVGFSVVKTATTVAP